MLYPARLSFSIEEIRSFSYKQKLKEFISTKLTLKEVLKGHFKWKRKGYNKK